MFLGSNSVRRLNTSVFKKWQHLEYLTLVRNFFLPLDLSFNLQFVGQQLVDQNYFKSIFALIDRTPADILTSKLVDKSDLKFVGTPPKRESISFICQLENLSEFKRLKKMVARSFVLIDLTGGDPCGALSRLTLFDRTICLSRRPRAASISATTRLLLGYVDQYEL